MDPEKLSLYAQLAVDTDEKESRLLALCLLTVLMAGMLLGVLLEAQVRTRLLPRLRRAESPMHENQLPDSPKLTSLSIYKSGS